MIKSADERHRCCTRCAQTRGRNRSLEEKMGRVSRLLLGFTLAPMPLFLLFCGLGIAYTSMGPNAAMTTGMLALFSLGLTLVFGLPSHIVLQRFGKRKLWHYVVAALVLPTLVLVGMFLWGIGQAFAGGYDRPFESGVVMAMIITPCVEVTAALFWFITVWRSPEPGRLPDAMLAQTFG